MTCKYDLPECSNRPEYGKCIAKAAEYLEDKDAFRGATFLITGASGMVGGALCRLLLYLNRTEDLGAKLLLPVRASTRKETLFGILDRSEVTVFEHDLAGPFESAIKTDYIVHAACPTASSLLSGHSADSAVFSALSTINLLEMARHEKPKGMVYLSSMEAYGKLDGLADETMSGLIDLTSPRSCYPESKRYCENLIACFWAQYGIRAVSARLAQVLGAGIKPNETRAYAQFAKCALKKEAIVLKTDGLSRGNYVHLSDALCAILLLLSRGVSGEIYNVSGDNASLTIREFAGRISLLLSNGESRIVFDIPPDAASLPYASKTGLILGNAKLKCLGFKSRFTLDDMILSLGKDLIETNAV